MSKMVIEIEKQLKTMISVLIITICAITLISWVGAFNLPRVFFIVGIIYTLIGVFSCLNNYKLSTDIGYQQVKSVSSSSYYNNSIEDFNLRIDFKLLIYSGATGIILMLISGLLESSNITIFAINLLKNIL